MRVASLLLFGSALLGFAACGTTSNLGSGTDEIDEGGQAGVVVGAGAGNDSGANDAGSGGVSDGPPPTNAGSASPPVSTAPTSTPPVMPTSGPPTMPTGMPTVPPTMPTGMPTSVPPPSALPPPIAPPDCAGIEKLGNAACTYTLSCDSRTAYSECDPDSNGGYRCLCLGPNSEPLYRLSVETRENPCLAAAVACLDGTLHHEGPRLCEEIEGQSDVCSLERLCSQTLVETSADASVEEISSSSVRCTANGDASRCACNDGRAYAMPTDPSSCGLLMDICDGEPEREVGETECFSENEVGQRDACSASGICKQAVELRDGVTALREDSEQISCFRDGERLPACTCSGPESLQFRVDLPSFEAVECAALMSVCTNDIEWNGELACSTISQEASPTDCAASVDCARPGTSAGRTIYRHATMSTDCKEAAPGLFECNCLGLTIMTIKVNSASPWAACTEAVPLCIDAIDLGI